MKKEEKKKKEEEDKLHKICNWSNVKLSCQLYAKYASNYQQAQ